MLPDLHLNDHLRLRKQHQCGSYEWTVTRLGADIGLELKAVDAASVLLLLNPADNFRILNIFSLEEMRTLYGLATVFPEALANPWLLGLTMLFWIAAPLALAYYKFRN